MLSKKLTSGLASLLLLVVTGSCVKKKSTDKGELQSKAPVTFSACMSSQGNGYMYTSLLGSTIALLENNIVPKVASGNSAASITSAITRAILTNPTVSGGDPAKPFTVPQRAARVLGASMSVYNSLAFPTENVIPSLPAITESALRTLALGQVISPMESQFFSTNVPLGMSMLAIEFFQFADFSEVYKEPLYEARKQKVQDLWVSHTNALTVDFKTLVNTIIRPLPEGKAAPAAFKIKKRFHELISGAPFKSNSVTLANLESYEKYVSLLRPLIKNYDEDALAKEFENFIYYLMHVPVVGTNANFFTKTVVLPDPARVFQAANSKRADDSAFEMPDGVLIHATAREVDSKGEYIGGMNSLTQLLYPAKNIAEDLVNKRNSLAENNSFLAMWPQNGVIIPKKNLLVVKNYSPVDPVRITMSEPVVFKREKISVSKENLEANAGFKARDMVGYGGWLDLISLPTVAQLAECSDVDFMVYVGLPSVDSIKLMILRGVVKNGASTYYQGEPEVDLWFKKFEKYHSFAKTFRGTKGTLALDFDWNDIFQSTSMLMYIQNNRSAMLAASYLDSVRKVEKVLENHGETFKNGFVFDKLIGNTEFVGVDSIEQIYNIGRKLHH